MDYNLLKFAAEVFFKLALRKNQLAHLLSGGGSFGIMSSYVPTSKSTNKLRHGHLLGLLQKAGLNWEDLKGEWAGKREKSILIPNIPPALLFELAKLFNQESVIYKSQDGVIGMYYPSSNQVEVAVDSNADPAFQVALDNSLWSKTRGPLSLEFGFLWGQKIPWDGKTPISKENVVDLIDTGILRPLA